MRSFVRIDHQISLEGIFETVATLDQNKKLWDDNYDWQDAGDEWSETWGSPGMQWHGAILPRVKGFLPAGHVLEIAPGYGRWTQFLARQCTRLTVVDLAEKCINACRERFADFDHIKYHTNDGTSLDMISDGSVDFVFSFDSLVHAEPSVVQSYVRHLARILNTNGVACIHHSNLNEFMQSDSNGQWVPSKILKKEANGTHWRDPGMSAEKMRLFAESSGLVCITQELIHWGTEHAQIDCISTLTPRESKWSRDTRVFRNSDFMREAAYWGKLNEYYSY